MSVFDFNRIHRYHYDDLNVLLDVNSGSLHLADDLTMRYLDVLEESDSLEEAQARFTKEVGQETAQSVQASLDDLIQAGTLFSDVDFSQYDSQGERVVKALCLHMAHDCNLRCRYCFADTGAYGGPRGLMSKEVGEAAIDFLIDGSGNKQHIEVDFFGGEPLLNKDLCIHLADYGTAKAAEKGKTLKCTLTTNGVLLDDDTIAWLNEHNIDAVLSMDGRKEIHDAIRPTIGGGASYDHVVPAFQKLAQSRDHQGYYLRGTYTHANTDFAEDVIHMVDDLGFKEISMEPVVAPQDKPYALKEEDKPDLLASYDKLTKHVITRAQEGKGYHFFHFNINLDGGPCLPKRLSGCGAGHDYLAVSPEGDLYPCHQFVGDPDYKIGDVFKGVEKPEMGKAFQAADVRSKDVCMACWARFFCSGGCHANNIRYGGDLNTPYAFGCDLQRKRIECALYIKCKEALGQA